MRRIILFFLLAGASFLTKAQVNWASIGVDGLTCSACTRSVEMSIRKLDFVDSVSMNLEHTEGKVFFKKGAKVDVDKISKAVVDAGFSLRYLRAGMIFNDIKISDNTCIEYEGDFYQFIKTESKTLKGETEINFIGNKFLSNKELKTWKPLMKSVCTDKKAKVYFVTI